MIEERRTFRAVTRDRLARLRIRVMQAGGAHGDNVGVVSGSRDGGVPMRPQRIVTPIIASGHHHDDASLPRRFRSLAEWIQSVTLKDRPTEREVQNANVICGLERDRLLNGCDYGAVGAPTISVEHAKIDDVGFRSDPAIDGAVSREGIMAVRRDDPRHMRAVSIRVLSAGVAGDEALAIDNA